MQDWYFCDNPPSAVEKNIKPLYLMSSYKINVLQVRSWSFLLIKCLYRNLGTFIDSPLFLHFPHQFPILRHFSPQFPILRFLCLVAQVCILLSTSHQFPIHRVQCRKMFSEIICCAQVFLVNWLAISWNLIKFSHIFNISFQF